MKKKVLVLILGVMMALSVTACGSEAEVEDTDTGTEVAEETVEETGEEPAEEATEEPAEDTEAAQTDGFALTDLSADMIDQGMYASDEDGNELVITLFTAPDETPMVSMFVSGGDGGVELICGAYGPDSITKDVTDEGVTVSSITTTDVYTGEEYTIIFAEKDGQAYVGSPAGSLFEGEYLSAEDTIDYMAAALAAAGQQ